MIPIRGSIRGSAPPTITALLIFVNVILFLFEVALPPDQIDELVNAYGMIPLRQYVAITRGTVPAVEVLVPLVSSQFLHGGWSHLGGNMLYLWVFGSGLESKMGSVRYAALYLVCGVLATQAQFLIGPTSDVPMIGASGAIAGVLGAYLALYPRASISVILPIFFWPLFFQVPAIVFLGIWFLEQFLVGTTLVLTPRAGRAGGVAFWAHIGGFIAGALLARVFRKPYADLPPRASRRGGFG